MDYRAVTRSAGLNETETSHDRGRAAKMSIGNASIETSGYPLVFRADPDRLDLETNRVPDEIVRIRVVSRPLAGMQKEALIHYGPTGSVWRVVCDEGPWLNGTDLAPFPLAFFTAGLAASFMSGFLEEARARGVRVDSASLEQDNFFSMEGSALRGTMSAGARPVQVTFSAGGNVSAATFKEIAEVAVRMRSPAERCLQQALASGFAVRANNQPLPWPGESANRVAALLDPATVFERVRPVSADDLIIIRKTAGCGNTHPEKTNPDAVGLQAEQKRIVHVRTECIIREDGLKSINVQCIRPAGSRFELLSDDSRAAGGRERAPSGLAWLSAGAAFCFMTQIGRYAHISKQNVNGYRIIQDTGFRLARHCEPDADAVETLVCLDTGESPDKSIQLVRMGEQTCYVHASYRASGKTEVRFSALTGDSQCH